LLKDERITNPLSRHHDGSQQSGNDYTKDRTDIFDPSTRHNGDSNRKDHVQPERSHFIGDDPDERNVANQPSTSMNPSNFPSLVPSTSPSMHPTLQIFQSLTPSMRTSTAPSTSPTNDCTLDNSGLFGVEADANATLEYEYEVEYQPTEDLSSIVNSIEVLVGQSIIPILFPETCSTNNLRRRMETIDNTAFKPARNNKSDDKVRILRQKIVGFSIKPDDKVHPEGKCQVSPEVSDNQCSVVYGKMTLFFYGDENEERKSILNAINAAMILGEFNQIQGVQRVTFRNRQEPASARSADDSGSFPLWAIMLIIVGCLVLIGIIVSLWRRRAHRVDADNSLSQGGEFDKFGQDASASVNDIFQSSDTVHSKSQSQRSSSRNLMFDDLVTGQGSNHRIA